MVPLICLSLAHWGILWRGMFVIEATWDPTTSLCHIVKLDNKFLQTTFFSSQCFASVSAAGSDPDRPSQPWHST